MVFRQATLSPNAVGPPFARPRFALSPLRALARLGFWFLHAPGANLGDLSNHLLRDVGIARDQLDLVAEGRLIPGSEHQ
jgi:uncharacterized protein YjiS (DUF1127 family)